MSTGFKNGLFSCGKLPLEDTREKKKKGELWHGKEDN